MSGLRLEQNASVAGSVILPAFLHETSEAHRFDHRLVIFPQGSNYSLFWVGSQSTSRLLPGVRSAGFGGASRRGPCIEEGDRNALYLDGVGDGWVV